jgi:hypothetical protein
MLGFDQERGSFLHDARRQLECDLLVVDEMSMLDVALGHHLFQAIDSATRVVLVGDPDQLPSVAPGNVLVDLIRSKVVPTFRLTHIHRQERGSLIVANAHRILAGETPILPARGDMSADFFFFPAEDAVRCAERVVEVVTERIPRLRSTGQTCRCSRRCTAASAASTRSTNARARRCARAGSWSATARGARRPRDPHAQRLRRGLQRRHGRITRRRSRVLPSARFSTRPTNSAICSRRSRITAPLAGQRIPGGRDPAGRSTT